MTKSEETSMTSLAHRAGTPLWLARLYPLPEPLVSIEEFYRSRHADLPGLDTAALFHERYRCRHRAMIEDTPHPCLHERLDALTRELARRGISSSGWHQ